MKISVTMKTPDAMDTAIDEAIEREIASGNLTGDAADACEGQLRNRLSIALQKWIQYGEYLTVDFDTDTNTATVRKVGG